MLFRSGIKVYQGYGLSETSPVVNGLSAIMWAIIAFSGEKVYSTVIMWTVYFILAIYFYFEWKKEVDSYFFPF